MDLVVILVASVFCLLAGFVDAVAGGGGLVSLPGYYLANLPAHTAIGTNKINSLLASAVAMASYARRGYIPWKPALACAVVGLGGSCMGAILALALSADVFMAIMIVLLPATAIYLLRSKSFSQSSVSAFEQRGFEPIEASRTPLNHATLFRALAASALIGFYDGFYGPGSGTFLLVLYTGFAHLPLAVANGVSKVVICATNLAGMTVFFFGGQALIIVGLIAGVASMVGSAIGAWAFSRNGVRLAKPLILVVLGIFFVRILIDLAMETL